MGVRATRRGSSGDGIGHVVQALHESRQEHAVLELLDQHARQIVADDLVHRLLPHLSTLAGYHYDGRPWAALVAGAALCGHDRHLGRRLLQQSRLMFAERGQPDGVGLAWFVEGLEELSEGRSASANDCWERARPLIGDVSAVRMIGAHEALAAFVDGDVQRSIVLAEQAVWVAQQRGDRRAESICHLVLALTHLVTGRFSTVEHSIDSGLGLLGELPPADRYEHPMFLVEKATLLTFRRDSQSDSLYAEAIDAARRHHNEWYEAIGRATRAAFTAHLDPSRALADARAALDYFTSVDETWWSHTARLGFAIAHLRVGNTTAAAAACDELLAAELTPFDRGRALRIRSEVCRLRGEASVTEHLQAAVDAFASIGARYWQARAEIRLATIDTRRGEYHHRRAAACTPPAEASDPAWRLLLLGEGALTMRLLGERFVAVDGRPVTFSTRHQLELLAMLALQPAGVDRAVIGERLWPADDDQRVQHRIDNLLSSVRRALAPAVRLHTTRGRVKLATLPGECDVRDLSAEIAAELREARRSPHGRAELADRLLPRLLEDLAAPWLVAEQSRLDEMGDRLRGR